MKIIIERKEKETFKKVLIPTVIELAEEIADGKVNKEELEEAYDMFDKTSYHKIGNIIVDKESENTTIDIKNEAICDAIIIVSNLYSKFKPIIKLAKSFIETYTSIFMKYTEDLEEFSEKWEDTYGYEVMKLKKGNEFFEKGVFLVKVNLENHDSEDWNIAYSECVLTELGEKLSKKALNEVVKLHLMKSIKTIDKEKDYFDFDNFEDAYEKTKELFKTMI